MSCRRWGRLSSPAERFDCSVAIVEDDSLTQQWLRRALGKTLPDSIYFAEGQPAIEYFSTRRTRVLIVDYSLPGLNGLEVLQTLNDTAPQCASRRYLTSAGDLPPQVIEEARRLGCALMSKDIFRRKPDLIVLLGES